MVLDFQIAKKSNVRWFWIVKLPKKVNWCDIFLPFDLFLTNFEFFELRN